MNDTCMKHKMRNEDEKKSLMNRLSRVEGQVRGVKNMVENDLYCTDVLIQVAAIQSALNSFNKELLEEHIKTCVVNDIKEGKEDEVIEELMTTIKKLMK